MHVDTDRTRSQIAQYAERQRELAAATPRTDSMLRELARIRERMARRGPHLSDVERAALFGANLRQAILDARQEFAAKVERKRLHEAKVAAALARYVGPR